MSIMNQVLEPLASDADRERYFADLRGDMFRQFEKRTVREAIGEVVIAECSDLLQAAYVPQVRAGTSFDGEPALMAYPPDSASDGDLPIIPMVPGELIAPDELAGKLSQLQKRQFRAYLRGLGVSAADMPTVLQELAWDIEGVQNVYEVYGYVSVAEHAVDSTSEAGAMLLAKYPALRELTVTGDMVTYMQMFKGAEQRRALGGSVLQHEIRHVRQLRPGLVGNNAITHLMPELELAAYLEEHAKAKAAQLKLPVNEAQLLEDMATLEEELVANGAAITSPRGRALAYMHRLSPHLQAYPEKQVITSIYKIRKLARKRPHQADDVRVQLLQSLSPNAPAQAAELMTFYGDQI